MNSNYYGSDGIIQALEKMGIEYISFNPGATIRGLQDSAVQSKDIHLILSCHEQIAVAIAHGYAKASGKCMAVLLHSNVGLLNASMAIFNAWCDRVPMLIINGCGPMDTEKRRPWIDWIHTSQHQGSVVSEFIKWYDQPSSYGATINSLYKALMYTNSVPKAPVLVCIDTEIQENHIDVSNNSLNNYYQSYVSPQVPQEHIEILVNMLLTANFPVLIVDNTVKTHETLLILEALVNLLAIPVIDNGGRFNLASENDFYFVGDNQTLICKSDFILALDVIDLKGALNITNLDDLNITHVTLDGCLIDKWSGAFHDIYSVRKLITADSERLIPTLLKECSNRIDENISNVIKKRANIFQQLNKPARASLKEIINKLINKNEMKIQSVLSEIWEAIKNEDIVLTQPGSYSDKEWIKKIWRLKTTDFHLGVSGGAGLGYGLGASIGAAIAYKNTSKLCINIQPDGDLLFMPSALWTLAHYKLPLLIIVVNNNGYANTKMHSVKTAWQRRQVSSGYLINSDICEPTVNYTELAQAYGIKAFKQVKNISDVKDAITEAIQYIKNKHEAVIIDVVIESGNDESIQ